MELGFDWEQTAAETGQTQTGTGHLLDQRIHPGYNALYTRCSALTNPAQFNQAKCRYYKKASCFNRCMYQKWDKYDMCDKVTIGDKEVN